MAFDFKAARIRMVQTQIAARGISDPEILRAFETVPRHEFVPEAHREEAYRDAPLPIGEGQTISQPYMVASMTHAVHISKGLRVLEIGTGSGYQAAILAELGARVISVERLPRLAEKADAVLKSLGYEVEIRVGDGTLGLPDAAPFDRIIVTAGAPALPSPLPDQISEGGRIVIPIEEAYCQVLCVFEKIEGVIREERHERCTFVPLIGRHGWPE